MKKDYAKGKESILYIKYKDIWTPISCELTSEMEEHTDMTGTTTRDNMGWKSYKPMAQGYSLSFAGQVVKEEDAELLSYFRLKEIKRNKEVLEWKRETINGFYIDTGTALITDMSDSNPVGELMTFNMTLLGQGKPIMQPPINLVEYEDEKLVIYTNGENYVKYE